MGERQPNHVLDPQHTPYEGGNGAPGLPRTIHESANPQPESRAHPTLPQKSALNRAVEQTRNLYEKNRWVILPLGEAGHGSLILSKSQTEQSTQSEGGSRAGPPALDEEMADVKERIEAVRRAARGATFFSGGGLSEVITRRKGKEEQSG